MRRRLLAGAGLALVVVAVAIPVGRLEGKRFDDSQNRGLAAVHRTVGALDQPSLTHFRLQRGLTCLVYGRRGNPLALELCFDRAGRLIEGVDRRGKDVRRWSLAPHPGGAEIRESPDEVERIRERLYDAARAEAARRLEASRS